MNSQYAANGKVQHSNVFKVTVHDHTITHAVFSHSPDCEATAKGRPKLREHLRSHTQEKVVACPGCGGMYANNTKFFDHIIRQSAMEGKCDARIRDNVCGLLRKKIIM